MSEVLLDWKTNDVTLVTIDKVEIVQYQRAETWTHYANIDYGRKDGYWELNSQFKGINHDEMWIYGYFKKFGDAVRNLATKGTKGRRPIKIY